MITPFVFVSERLPLIKAKQLQKAFRFLKLSVAQDATARALGYASSYECSKSGTKGTPSRSDEEAGMATRVARYYHQANVLTGIGIAPGEADVWVRAWGLTGSPTLAPSMAVPAYYELHEAANRIERGEMAKAEIDLEWQEAGWSKYPGVDRPVNVCRGVVLSPGGKYPHYYIDPELLGRAPDYIRGSMSAFHYEDNGDMVAMIVDGFKKNSWDRSLVEEFNVLQYEWHFGRPHPDFKGSAVGALCEAAMKAPGAMVVLSVRMMPMDMRTGRLGSYALACLRGVDFAEFVKNKGRLDASKVVWFRDVEEPPRADMHGWLMGMSDEVVLPVFKNAEKYQEALPVYSYPFKEGPMARYEYSAGMERNKLLALELDYESEDEDEEGEGDSGDGEAADGLKKVRTKAEAKEEIFRLDHELASLMEENEDLVGGGVSVDKESPRWIAYAARHKELISQIRKAVHLREMFALMESKGRETKIKQ